MEYLQIRQNFERHGFTTQLFFTKEEVCCYLADILHNQTIGFGGSETLMEMGLFEVLQQNNVLYGIIKFRACACESLQIVQTPI